MSDPRLKRLALEIARDAKYPMGSKPNILANLILLHFDPQFFSHPIPDGAERTIKVSTDYYDLDAEIMKERGCPCLISFENKQSIYDLPQHPDDIHLGDE